MDALAKTIGTSEFKYSMTVYSTFQRRLFDVRRIRWCVTIIATFDTLCKRDMWFYCHVFLSPLNSFPFPFSQYKQCSCSDALVKQSLCVVKT